MNIIITETETEWLVEDSIDLCDPISCDSEQDANDEAEGMADAIEDETGTRPSVERR